MSETPPPENNQDEVKPRRLHFEWLLPIIIKPRKAFEQITHAPNAVWLTPLLLLMALALVRVITAGVIGQMSGGGAAELPPDFQYWSPEQQAQYMQAQSASSGPVFAIIFPSIISLLALWVGWLILGGVFHLALTLFGARSSTATTMNLSAWALIPFGVRDAIQIIGMIIMQQPIRGPGLAGFAPADAGMIGTALVACMGLIDIYLIWHVVLLVVGANASGGLSRGRVWASVLVVMILVNGGQALLTFVGAQLANLTTGGGFF
jgi:hypothetical protein